MFKATYENMKKFVSGILKKWKGKLDVEENPRIEGCVNPMIKEKCNLAPKPSPVDYADMLLPLIKIYAG